MLAEHRRVVLHTEFRDGETPEFSDVWFTGVLAHEFRCVLPGNILFDIEEVDPGEVYDAHVSTFESLKPHGWPGISYHDRTGLLEAFASRGLRGYLVRSSYGLEGWVLAEAMRIEARGERWGDV